MLYEHIARVVVGILSLTHAIFSNWVNVTNVSGNESPIGTSITPYGQALLGNLAVMNVYLARITADLLTVIHAVGL